ncbi:SAF domain-containing protein [Psychrobacillus sp. FSL H8-0487]|uniref:SAF domain-containing protein n=1 Tax=Psychrobacillus sp. FSL H8-0487 TaxID=2921391 RepID=UPI0030F9638C
MKKKINKSLFLSIFFFALFVVVVIANEMNFFKHFTSVEVVVASEIIQKDTVITDEMLTTMEYERGRVNDSMLRNLSDVIGKTATQIILPSQYVSSVALDQSILRPTSEHEFFSIPDAWLMDIQGTLRRYDLINISAVFVGAANQETATIETHKTKINSSHVLKDVPIAYVKGGRNQEVTGTTVVDNRLYGTQNPSSIELSLTLEDFKKLESLYIEGYKLIISY